MVVVAAYAPGTQGDAALKAAIREVFLTSRELVIASYLFDDPQEGRRSADRREVEDALARVSSTLSHQERAYLETLKIKIESSDSTSVGDFLTAVARSREASLIVIALRQSGPTGRLTLGSSVKKLLLTAPCPVLVAKA